LFIAGIAGNGQLTTTSQTGVVTDDANIILATTNSKSLNLSGTEGTLSLTQQVNANNGTTVLGAMPGEIGLSSVGTVSQSGSGLIIGATLDVLAADTVSLGLANRLGENDQPANASGVAQTSGIVTGDVTTTGQGFAFTDDRASLTVGTVSLFNAGIASNGQLSLGPQSGVTTAGGAGGTVNLQSTTSGDVVLNNAVSAPGSNVALVSSAGNVNEASGITVNSSGLIIDPGKSANFGSTNNIATLAGKIGGSIDFVNGPSLTVGSVPAIGNVAAQSGLTAGAAITLQTISGGITITGNVAANGGNMLVSSAGPIAVNGTVTLGASSNIILASTGAFSQSGSLAIAGPDLVIDTTGLNASRLLPTGGGVYTQGSQVLAIGTIPGSFAGGAVSFAGLSAANTTLFITAGSGAITGSGVNVSQLGVVAGAGTATLTGSISGNSSTTAAELGFAVPAPSNNYRFNTCAIGSVSCVALPALSPIQPAPINNFEVNIAQPAADDLDAPLTNIFDENRLCDELYRTSPDLAQKVCQ
jgi:hypothetical protein